MTILPTSLVGSYPQPDWLIDREALASHVPARVRARDLWRVDERWLREAQDDATLLAIRDQERAGLDIVTDGEIRRESYSNRFATALHGIDLERPGTTLNRSGNPIPVPRVTGPLRRDEPLTVDDLRFLRANTDRLVKVTLPGPFTMAQQAQNDFYERRGGPGPRLRRRRARGDARPLRRRRRHRPARRAVDGVARRAGPPLRAADARARLGRREGTTALHICFGYPAFVPDHPPAYSFLSELAASPVDQISIETAQSNLDLGVLDTLVGKTVILGVIALDTAEVETPETVAERIRRALPHKGAAELIAAPDCGMKYLPREAAFAKLEALVAGAQLVRAGLPG